jgi:hypothetical protein
VRQAAQGTVALRGGAAVEASDMAAEGGTADGARRERSVRDVLNAAPAPCGGQARWVSAVGERGGQPRVPRVVDGAALPMA